MNNKVLLVILDGWGYGEANTSNPIHIAKTPNLDYLKKNFNFRLLQASGQSIGFPKGEPGNSEIGHLTIGTGRVYYQNYPRITLDIESGRFFENDVLKQISKRDRIHLIGLLSQGIQHSSFEHLLALLRFFKNKKVFLHLFLDGKDSAPKSGLNLLIKLEKEILKLNSSNSIKIATICGRDYGMNTEENYKTNTQRTYNLIMKGISAKGGFASGEGIKPDNYKEYIAGLYENIWNDNILEPILIDSDGIVKDNDAVLFFNFAADGMRQLFRTFVDENFNLFPIVKKQNLLIASMTEYVKNAEIPVLYKPQKIESGISKIISDSGLKQIKITETSKEKLLTYFFNGMEDSPNENEFFKILPASKEPLYKNPLMQSHQLTQTVISALSEGFDFIAANYAAPDVIGHFGNFDLAVKVVGEIDKIIGKIAKIILENNKWTLIIASDHGNLESIIDLETGEKDTVHNTNPVPLYLVSKPFYSRALLGNKMVRGATGTLTEIAPIILKLFELK